MKSFISRLIKFSLPLIVLACAFITYAEYTLYHYPSVFQLKAIYFKENKNDIDVLILGSSHNQNAINPEVLKDFNCSNLAFSMQDIRIDSALFVHAVEHLSKLRYAVIELSYHTLEHRNTKEYERNCWYLRFYDINLYGRSVNPLDYSIYLSNPKRYNRVLNPFTEKTPVNKYGFATELSRHDKELQTFKNLKYDEEAIMKDTLNTLIKRHKYENIDAYKKNTAAIDYMIKTCIKNDIIPIIISPPVYKSYINSYINSKERRRQKYLQELLSKYPSAIYLNFERDTRFTVTDFKNDDHLNPDGAQKFSIIFNDTLLEIKEKNLHSHKP